MTSLDRVRVKGVQIHRSIIYGNTATIFGPGEKLATTPADHTHKWTVAVRSAASAPDSDIVGGADDISYFIKRVTFKLHDSYPNFTRHIDKPPFEVTETGWGEFEIQIRISFVQESGEKPVVFYHHLKLHPWTAAGAPEAPPDTADAIAAGPVHSYQYDEIVFSDPFQSFLATLTAHQPTPLPSGRNKPVPFHLADLTPGALERSQGGVPEFTTKMIEEEKQRLETARKQVIEMEISWRSVLIQRENEVEKLKKQLAEQAAL